MPPSAFVSVPAPVPRILVSVPPAAPPNVSPYPEPVIVPALLMVMVPVPPMILLVLPRVINPAIVEPVDELFIKAPPLVIPVPFNVIGSLAELVNEYPLRSRTAPAVTDVVPAVVPRGPAVDNAEDTPSFNVPALIVVPPVNVLAPERVNVPEPLLVKAPVPLMMPAYAAGLVVPPTVSIAAPSVTLPPVVPPPVIEPICVLYNVISMIAVASFAIVTAELLPNAPLVFATEVTPALRVPALTVVAPE